MKRLLVMLVLLAVSLAVLAEPVVNVLTREPAVVKHASWEFPRDGKPTLYIEVLPDGALMLYEQDAKAGHKRFIGKRLVMCIAEQQ